MSPRNRFYIFDLDRTVFDTVKGSEILVNLIKERSEAAAAEAVSRIHDLTMVGASFSIRDLLVEIVGEDVTKEVYGAFEQSVTAESLLLPGAQELMQFAAANGTGWGILTYGSPEGQLLKLQAVQLDKTPYIITDKRDKGELLRTWRQEDGSFLLPGAFNGEHVQELIFVDDRLFSFDGLPEGVIGYWIAPELSVMDAVEHPKAVTPVRDLHAVIAAEQSRLSIDKS